MHLTINSRFTFRSASIKSTTDESFSCNFIYFNTSQYEINYHLLLLLHCNFEINSVDAIFITQTHISTQVIIYKMLLTIYFSAHISKLQVSLYYTIPHTAGATLHIAPNLGSGEQSGLVIACNSGVRGMCWAKVRGFFFFLSRKNGHQTAFQLTNLIIISPNICHSSLSRFPRHPLLNNGHK